MSSTHKRARKDQANSDHELNDLIKKLQALLPASSSKGEQREKVAALKIIKETCNYIKSLQKEVKNAGLRISQLLDYVENNGLDVDILTNLLQQ
ncbi:hypothetical protein L1987_51720 [Smallanthus sonchifolius]|uniref:Uncharacterized protein n=1 Tax=Smallanthus sonchifolius TaxID=185202 RepID=A0ACB9ERQ7_9ASTR|nr:hypothetical protein L1987_51720 [Smallanthus sonchifolius]